MILSRVLPQAKDPDLAKNFAVFTTLGLILLGFAFPYLMTWLFSLFPEDTPEWAKGLVVAAGALWFCWDMTDAMVSSAIKAATNQEISNYEEQNPDLAKIINTQRLEFCCFIPTTSRAKSSVVEKMAEGAVVLTLAQLGQNTTSPQDFRNFLNDIYAYLRAWLMLSIKYDSPMPVKYIKQRYPNEYRPNNAAYIRAIENIINMLEIPEVMECLDPRHRKSAISVAKEYLGTLINLLDKSDY
jgi:hypothetical protein